MEVYHGLPHCAGLRYTATTKKKGEVVSARESLFPYFWLKLIDKFHIQPLRAAVMQGWNICGCLSGSQQITDARQQLWKDLGQE